MTKKDFKFKRRGSNIIISAPSGAGKSTLVQKLLATGEDLEYSISATTREKRPSEVDGSSYYFKTKEAFYDLISKNAFIEYAEVFGNFYGTLVDDVEKRLSSGKDVLFDLDWQGATILKNKMPEDTLSIFVLPPSIAELERRIRSRKQDSEDVILYRMAKSRSEISHYYQYDYVVINDSLDVALQEIQAIILANRLKRDKLLNMEDFITNL
ncbi:MAG: guanylate kinase [Alphaproteobacteria bacterium]|jgi:guanylate kinase|nr:guanylate kinase [Alphaproteobacteria bacterium]